MAKTTPDVEKDPEQIGRLKLFELEAVNTCHDCGEGPYPRAYAANVDAATAGQGVCINCAQKRAAKAKKPVEGEEA